MDYWKVGEKMRLKKIVMIVLLFCAFFAVSPVKVFAEEAPLDLPVITQWMEGKGYDSDGKMLADTWAYDSVNASGKYVLFGTEGEVLQKAEDWQERNETGENYSVTDQNTGIIAIRCSTFPDFTGIIEGVLEEKGGTQYPFELDYENGYSSNVSVGAGNYRLKLTAYDDKFYYQISVEEEQIEIQESDFEIINLQVTQSAKDRLKEQDTAEHEEELALGGLDGAGQGLSEEELKKMGTFFLLTVAICLTGYGIYRKRKKTYT